MSLLCDGHLWDPLQSSLLTSHMQSKLHVGTLSLVTLMSSLCFSHSSRTLIDSKNVFRFQYELCTGRPPATVRSKLVYSAFDTSAWISSVISSRPTLCTF